MIISLKSKLQNQTKKELNYSQTLTVILKLPVLGPVFSETLSFRQNIYNYIIYRTSVFATSFSMREDSTNQHKTCNLFSEQSPISSAVTKILSYILTDTQTNILLLLSQEISLKNNFLKMVQVKLIRCCQCEKIFANKDNLQHHIKEASQS